MSVPTQRSALLERSRGWQFYCQLRCQSGRSYSWEKSARLLVRALRASPRGPARRRILLRLSDLCHEAALLEQEAHGFALDMPVEFFAEYRVRKKAMLAKEQALFRLSPRAAPEFAEALINELTAFHEWFVDRARAYRRPWLDELDDILNAAERLPS